MLKIRLQRVGRKNDPSFRIVVTDSKNGPKSGNSLEVLGSYDARQGTPQIKGDRVKYWMSVGAQVSDTMNNLLVKEGVIEGKMINVLSKKSPIVKEKSEEAEVKSDTPAEDTPATEEKTEDAPAEEPKEEEKKEETSAEEVKEEKPEVKEEPKEEKSEEKE